MESFLVFFVGELVEDLGSVIQKLFKVGKFHFYVFSTCRSCMLFLAPGAGVDNRFEFRVLTEPYGFPLMADPYEQGSGGYCWGVFEGFNASSDTLKN